MQFKFLLTGHLWQCIFISIISSTLLFGCQPFKSLEYQGLSDWNVKPKSFLETKLSAKVSIYNPNKHQIKVRRIEAAIEVDGNLWSNYKLDSIFIVPALDTFSFPIDMMVKNASLISGAMRIGSDKDLPYLLKGKIKGSYRKITAEVPFEYSGRFTENDIKF